MEAYSADAFCRAVETPTPPQIRVEGPNAQLVETWQIYEPYILIGRVAGTRLVLSHSDVSRRHAYAQFLCGRMFAIDLGSRTGIHPTGEPSHAGFVDPITGMKLGPYLIQPERIAGTDDQPIPAWAENPLAPHPSPGAVGLPFCELDIQGRGRFTKCWYVDRVITLIGRGDPCALRLDNDGVSTVHAALVLTPQGPWIVDLLGRGGVLANGARVRHVQCAPHIEVRIGPFRINGRISGTLPLPRGSALATRAASSTLVPAPSAELLGSWTRELAVQSSSPVGDDAQRTYALIAPLLHQMGTMQQNMVDQFHQSMMSMFQAFGTMHHDTVGVLREELAELRKLTEQLQSLREEADKNATTDPDMPTVDPDDSSGENRASIKVDKDSHAAADSTRARWDPTPPGPDEHHVHMMLHRKIIELEKERETRWQRILKVIQRGS